MRTDSVDRLSSDSAKDVARSRALPFCPICADGMVAAESSAISADGEIRHLWSCENCGYGFVTRIRVPTCH